MAISSLCCLRYLLFKIRALVAAKIQSLARSAIERNAGRSSVRLLTWGKLARLFPDIDLRLGRELQTHLLPGLDGEVHRIAVRPAEAVLHRRLARRDEEQTLPVGRVREEEPVGGDRQPRLLLLSRVSPVKV